MEGTRVDDDESGLFQPARFEESTRRMTLCDPTRLALAAKTAPLNRPMKRDTLSELGIRIGPSVSRVLTVRCQVEIKNYDSTHKK